MSTLLEKTKLSNIRAKNLSQFHSKGDISQHSKKAKMVLG